MSARATTIEQVKEAERRWMLGAIEDIPTELGWDQAEYDAYKATGKLPVVRERGCWEPPAEAQALLDNPLLTGIEWTAEMLDGALRGIGLEMADWQIELMLKPMVQSQSPMPTPRPDVPDLMANVKTSLEHVKAPAPKTKAKKKPDKPKLDTYATKRDESLAMLKRKGIEVGSDVEIHWAVTGPEGEHIVRHTGTVKSLDSKTLVIDPCTTKNGELRASLSSPAMVSRIYLTGAGPTDGEYRPDEWWATHAMRWRWRRCEDAPHLWEIFSERTGELALEPNTFADSTQYAQALARAHELNTIERERYLAMPEKPKESTTDVI